MPTAAPKSTMHFSVSSGLKRVIGRELITDDEVAIFELVKNSFDAGATTVWITFTGESVTVLDNGDGMSKEDVEKKWLFVAYSSKRVLGASEPTGTDFREQIQDRKHYAGSKGIGRFSCDRLGSRLVLQTKSKNRKATNVNQIIVNWDLFEADDAKQFATIPVRYEELPAFALSDDLKAPKHGTAIRIEKLRTAWNRAKMLHLKASLAKLINPFGAASDGFRIELRAAGEIAADEAVKQHAITNGEEPTQGSTVNGQVGNFIFGALREKTTFIEAYLEDDGKYIVTSLTDRGELVYKIREPQPFTHIKSSGFRCELYYLNQSAKLTFSRRMGLPPVQFGSVFLFRNDFRVFPVGEAGDDWFGIDRRKQQGYARFLGTRDVIGRIDVSGSEDDFKEASSRNQGLIDTPAVRDMSECFWEFCLKRLERYVVPVSWVDKGEKDVDDLSRLLTDAGRARVSAAVARLVDYEDVEVLAYSKRLVQVLNERSGQFEESLVSLRAIAAKTKDLTLADTLNRAEKRFDELKAAEVEALRIAEEERTAKEKAQDRAEKAEAQAEQAQSSLEEERKRSLFLTSITSFDTQTIINMHHQITIYAADAKQQIENCLAAARRGNFSLDDLVSRLEQVAFINQKVLAVSRLATKANFRLESDMIEADFATFIEEYVKEGAAPFLGANMRLSVVNNGTGFIKRFRPMEVAIVIDNLVSNAKKAGSTELVFTIKKADRNGIVIEACDDGRGLPKIEDLNQLFDLGFSRTSGSGLGLYHVKQVLGEIKGSITVSRRQPRGTCFQMRITE